MCFYVFEYKINKIILNLGKDPNDFIKEGLFIARSFFFNFNTMIHIDDLIEHFSQTFPKMPPEPWEITKHLDKLLLDLIPELGAHFKIRKGIAIHKTAHVEKGATIKAPAIIEEDCFVAAGSYLRNGVYLGKRVKIGPGCEIKSSILFHDSAAAHFNFIGDSLVGSHVNFEAGSLTANHYNERVSKVIYSLYNDEVINTFSEKFGALVGDNSKIGANAVLSPGTVLVKDSVVKRLELVDQIHTIENRK